MIQLIQHEADFIIKTAPKNHLCKTSARKRHGGKTYYCLCDDVISLQALAKYRGITVKEILQEDLDKNL